MTRKLFGASLLASVLLVALVVPATAGGWAVTTMNEVPEFEAGEAQPVEYTVLQHGQHPADVGSTAIRATSVETGETVTFPGSSSGAEGEYTAEVSFPSAGEWQWQVVQGPYGTQPLGSIEVQEVESAGIGGMMTSGMIDVALPVAAGFAVMLFIVQLILLVRTRRRDAPVLSSPKVAGN